MTEEPRPPEQARLRLCDFILSRLPTILARWEHSVRSLPVANPLSARRLIDHMPEVLETIAAFTQKAHTGEQASMADSPEIHALDRLDEGFDLAAVTTEYALLRTCVLRSYREENAGEVPPEEVERFCCAIDEAIRLAVAHYTQARERTLIALDRIAEAALACDDVEKFLHKLLRVLLETTASIDSAVILLRDGELIRVHATVGLEEEVPADFRLQVGEGFAGKVAAERRPFELQAAEAPPLLQDEALRGRQSRTLYGVPLLDEEKVIGVAVVGSRSAFEFSATDKLLIRTMAHRATALITRAQLAAQERAARREAQEARARLEATEDFRERFLGIVSHDLRNPLSAIIASASFLRDDESLGDRQLRAVQRIARSAKRMARMIAELLDFTRGRLGGGIPLTRRSANLGHICQHVVDELEASHPGRELRLVAEGHFLGEWDADRLAQVVGNLGKNALDYSAEGTPVEFTLHDEGSTVCLEVHNLGAPIPADLIPHLFEPFRRATRDESRPTSGLGLGLYIVQQIVQAHGGTIEVRSTVADGTTFTVRLPRQGM